MKQIIVQCEQRTMKAAMLESGRLTDYFVHDQDQVHTAKNIYKGRVVNVLPGMEAAFIHIGHRKNAFLHLEDLLPAHLEKQPKVKPSITELVHEGQELMVQVVREAMGTKGARVTTRYSIPGRWIVYMPAADYVGVSRKIADDEERNRLKQIAEELREPGEGLILRTAAGGAPREALAADLRYLRNVWEDIRTTYDTVESPTEIYREPELLPRLIRDFFTDEIDELVIDDEQMGQEIKQAMLPRSPHLAERVRIYQELDGQDALTKAGAYRGSLFDQYGIDAQLDQLFRSKVMLDNGGYVMIDHTEALTVIDVNTGKFVGSVDLEETVFATNMEAAARIAQLLRLRNIGGIIIIDFIDMALEEHREQVKAVLEQRLKSDPAKCIVAGWTKLGLLEMTRKRTGSNYR